MIQKSIKQTEEECACMKRKNKYNFHTIEFPSRSLATSATSQDFGNLGASVSPNSAKNNAVSLPLSVAKGRSRPLVSMVSIRSYSTRRCFELNPRLFARPSA